MKDIFSDYTLQDHKWYMTNHVMLWAKNWIKWSNILKSKLPSLSPQRRYNVQTIIEWELLTKIVLEVHSCGQYLQRISKFLHLKTVSNLVQIFLSFLVAKTTLAFRMRTCRLLKEILQINLSVKHSYVEILLVTLYTCKEWEGSPRGHSLERSLQAIQSVSGG